MKTEEKVIDDVDKKWIPALSADFQKAKKVEDEFVRTSGAEERAKEALEQRKYSEAAKLFWEANKPKKVISAFEHKGTLAPEDYDLLKRACIAIKDAQKAGNTLITQYQTTIVSLINNHEVEKLGHFLDGNLVWLYLRAGDKREAAWARLLKRLELSPFNRLTGNDKEWLLGFINQKLLLWEIAAGHYNKAKDFTSSSLCWARAGSKFKPQLEEAKSNLQKQRQK